MATIPVSSADALTSKILSGVNALTRDLQPGELTLQLVPLPPVSLALTVQHAAAFSVATTPAKGPLPATVRPLSSMVKMSADLDQRLADVRQEAGDLIDAWVAEQAEVYRSALPPERCMRDRPVLGVQEVCPDCGGRKQVTCGGCRGAGRVTCGACGGRGRVSCSGCGGSRAVRCSACGGSGTHEVREFETTYSDRQQTMNQQRQLTRQVPCSGCGGRGTNTCGSCHDGTQSCTCQGGQVTCGGCGGSGIVPCATCAATGVVHHTGRVQCTVSRSIGVTVGGGTGVDQQTFRDRVPFEGIGAMAAETGGVRLQKRNRAGHQVTLDYSASIPLECAEGTVRGKAVAIRAYGPGREIYDYHDLVGSLLEPDLAGLEASLRANSLFTTTPGASLAGVTRTFLASELNALIAEAAPHVTRDGAVTTEPGRRARLGAVVRDALLLAPVIRGFRRSGIVVKLLMIVVALGILFSWNLVSWYLFVAFVCCFLQWRYLQRSPAEAPAPPPADTSSASSGAQAVKAAQAPVTTGMVSAGYVQRASAAIGQAVPRLYGPLVLPWGLWIAGGLLVLFVVEKNFFFRWSEAAKELALLGLTGVAWFVVERRASASLVAILGAELHERLKGQFRRTRNRYRLLPVGAYVVSLLLVELLIRLVAHFRYGAPIFQ
jgi:hypothetical protein